jgi:hypothetical protein
MIAAQYPTITLISLARIVIMMRDFHTLHAQKSVDRLGRAIEAAEEEMDAALKRTTEVHRSQLKQKELEILELQRVIGAKERSVDSLRDTLATTKRTYESKLSQAESALALKDAEVRQRLLRDERGVEGAGWRGRASPSSVVRCFGKPHEKAGSTFSKANTIAFAQFCKDA